jgi:hypothetical protein
MNIQPDFLKLMNALIEKGVSAAAIEIACGMPKTKLSKIRSGTAKPKETEYQDLLLFVQGFETLTNKKANKADDVKIEFENKDKIIDILISRLEIERQVGQLEKELQCVINTITQSGLIDKELGELKKINRQIGEIRSKF